MLTPLSNTVTVPPGKATAVVPGPCTPMVAVKVTDCAGSRGCAEVTTRRGALGRGTGVRRPCGGAWSDGAVPAIRSGDGVGPAGQAREARLSLARGIQCGGAKRGGAVHEGHCARGS